MTVHQKMAAIHVSMDTPSTMDNASNVLKQVESMAPVLNVVVRPKGHSFHVRIVLSLQDLLLSSILDVAL